MPTTPKGFDEFGQEIAQEVIDEFWIQRAKNSGLNENGINKEDLERKVLEDMKTLVLRTRHNITSLIKGASDPERAYYTDIREMLVNTARISVNRSYEGLVFDMKGGIDELTGLPRRKVFDKELAKAIEANLRYNHEFSVVFFDLDKFKNVNDTYGHTAGDMVLVEMARRLSEDAKLREVDSLARYGGEEFVAILPETAKEGAAILAQRISEQIGSKAFRVKDMDGKMVDLKVTASIGIADYTSALGDPDGSGMIARADDALYVLKGERPDIDGNIENRRGQIACNGRVLSDSDIEGYKLIYKLKRSSLPPKNER